MRVIAAELDTSHIGSKLSYGPGMVFSGEIADVVHFTHGWLKRKRGKSESVVEMHTPPRVYVITTDGRAVSLAHRETIHLEGESP